MLHREVEGALRDAHGLRPDDGPAGVENLHGDLEAFARGGHEVLIGNEYVVEVDVRGRRGPHPQLAVLLSGFEARRARFHDQADDALGARPRLGGGEDEEGIGYVAVGDIGLGPVEEVAAVLGRGVGAAAGGVAARVGLGETEGADGLAACQGRHVLLLLGVGPEPFDADGGEREAGEQGQAHARIEAGELLSGDGGLQEAAAPAVALGGNAEAGEAQVAHLAVERGVERLRRVALARAGSSSRTEKSRMARRRSWSDSE